MDASTAVLTLATVMGLYMAWNIGANDVANAMGTSVGSGALTIRRAIVVAAIFEFAGAFLAGGRVTSTIQKGIVELDSLGPDPMVLASGMTCCLVAAAMWLHIASARGWPVSTTHSIVGAVAGFGIAAGGLGAVNWTSMATIASSWVISPLLGGMVGFGVIVLIRNRILQREKPLTALRQWGPPMLFPVFGMLTLAMIYKGLKHLRLDLPLAQALPIAAAVGLTVSLASIPVFRSISSHADRMDHHEHLHRTEQVFLVLQVITACYVAFAHGSNDVANAVGPMAAVFGAFQTGVTDKVEVSSSILLIGAVGIVIGLATYGYKVMGTVGREITELTPSRGFSAELSAATTILVASMVGLPVSTTHTLVGAVIGVGFARSIGAINLQVVSGIVASWFITVPFTAGLAAGLFLLVRAFFL
jgi:inorganic phosphate transporter, PiT family